MLLSGGFRAYGHARRADAIRGNTEGIGVVHSEGLKTRRRT